MRGRGFAVGVLAALLCLLAGAAPNDARAVVYWSSGAWVDAANLDGSKALLSYPYGASRIIQNGSTCGLAVNADHLFWADPSDGTIGQIGLSPAPEGPLDWYRDPRLPIDESLVSGLISPCGVAVDSGHLYWADSGTQTIGRANLDGGDRRPNLVLASSPCGVAVDSDHLYWGSLADESIGRAKLDGSGVEPEFIANAGRPCGVAVDASYVYWSDEDKGIGRAAIDGSAPQLDFIPAPRACGVAVDSSHLYWGLDNEVGSAVGRANLDGSGAGPLVTAPHHGGGCGVALDPRYFAPPTTYLRFGRVVRRPDRVAFEVDVKVLGPGEMQVDSPRVGWRVDKRNRGVSGGPLVWRLKLWPGRGTRAARRIHRQLRRRGRSQIILKLTFQQEGRQPLTAEKRLFFRVPTRNSKRSRHAHQ